MKISITLSELTGHNLIASGGHLSTWVGYTMDLNELYQQHGINASQHAVIFACASGYYLLPSNELEYLTKYVTYNRLSLLPSPTAHQNISQSLGNNDHEWRPSSTP